MFLTEMRDADAQEAKSERQLFLQQSRGLRQDVVVRAEESGPTPPVLSSCPSLVPPHGVPTEHARTSEHLKLIGLEVDGDVFTGQTLLRHGLGQRRRDLACLRQEELA